jgi:hypothetical protein
VTESAERSRLILAVKPMSENKPEPIVSPCLRCGEQLKLITKILDTRKGRIVHLLGCKCGNKTFIPEMAA